GEVAVALERRGDQRLETLIDDERASRELERAHAVRRVRRVLGGELGRGRQRRADVLGGERAGGGGEGDGNRGSRGAEAALTKNRGWRAAPIERRVVMHGAPSGAPQLGGRQSLIVYGGSAPLAPR